VIKCFGWSKITGQGPLKETYYYIILERMNFSLHHLLKFLKEQGKSLNLKQKHKILEDVAKGIQYIHNEIKIVHKDIKPENILINYLNGEFNAKICDFGISKQLSPNVTTTFQTFLTGNPIMCTPMYTPPEFISNNQISRSSDIYSFGCVMYLMILEKLPFGDLKNFEIIEKLKNVIKKIYLMKRIVPEVSLDDIQNTPFYYFEMIRNCLNIDDKKRMDIDTIVYKLLNHDITDPESLFKEGFKYFQGNGVKQNYSIAFQCFLESAELNHKNSQYNVGHCYKYGKGVKIDHKLAFKFYKLAAGNDHIESIFQVAYYRFEGVHVEKSIPEAQMYFLKAAGLGHTRSQYNIAICFRDGIGSFKNDSKAFKYFNMAAEKGHHESIFNVGYYYFEGKIVEKNDLKAFACFMESSKKGNSKAHFNLGIFHKNGWGGAKLDKSIAFEHFKKAADLDPIFSFTVAEYFETGWGVQKNFTEAFKYYKLASDQGNKKAFHALGNMYKEGIGVEKDRDMALRYYTLEQSNDRDSDHIYHEFGIII
jgi:TPR repeat protein